MGPLLSFLPPLYPVHGGKAGFPDFYSARPWKVMVMTGASYLGVDTSVPSPRCRINLRRSWRDTGSEIPLARQPKSKAHARESGGFFLPTISCCGQRNVERSFSLRSDWTAGAVLVSVLLRKGPMDGGDFDFRVAVGFVSCCLDHPY